MIGTFRHIASTCKGGRLQARLAEPSGQFCQTPRSYPPTPQSRSVLVLTAAFSIHRHFLGRGISREFTAGHLPRNCRAVHRHFTAMAAIPSLVDCQWLNARLNDGKTVVLDASWYMPIAGRDPRAEYKARRIPGARFFDLDKISDRSSTLPHMLPNEAAFAAAADALGISNDSVVVVYDGDGMFSAPRVWWTFQVFGHQQVAVLDGGLPAWKGQGLPLDESAVTDDVLDAPAAAAANPPASTKYQAKLQADMVRNLQQMRDNIKTHSEVVVDARSQGRWAGKDPEPRPGLPSGHIPGSHNVPFPTLLTPTKTYRPVEELKAAFHAAGVTDDSAIVASCGTGVTACILVLALRQIFPDKLVPVYDGSWTEWASLPDTPKGAV